MLITIAAIGKLKAGPERELFARFIERASSAGRNVGLTFAVREFPEGRPTTGPLRKDQEATALIDSLSPGTVLVALDEAGKNFDSRTFAERLGRWRDSGTTELALAVGGADGHGAALLEKSAFRLAFGLMTWPHQLVRVMVAEQLYRAVTILSGHPYHRD
jgi:23S rRNA (pseudouridine1915-N3)-methyltransferase